jgi:hypothetical protein
LAGSRFLNIPLSDAPLALAGLKFPFSFGQIVPFLWAGLYRHCHQPPLWRPEAHEVSVSVTIIKFLGDRQHMLERMISTFQKHTCHAASIFHIIAIAFLHDFDFASYEFYDDYVISNNGSLSIGDEEANTGDCTALCLLPSRLMYEDIFITSRFRHSSIRTLQQFVCAGSRILQYRRRAIGLWPHISPANAVTRILEARYRRTLAQARYLWLPPQFQPSAKLKHTFISIRSHTG